MIQSTMQWLSAENDRLRKSGRIDRIVYWSCIIGVGIIVGLEKWI